MQKLVILFLLLLVSCGKSPLLMKKDPVTVSGNSNYETVKSFKTLNHQLAITWLSPMNTTDVGHFLLLSKNNLKSEDIPGNFKVYLWMPSMGHGSSPVKVNRISTGIYEVTDVYFIMEGDWEIRIKLDNGDEASFPYYI